jgi:hypothetical protein
VSELTITTDFSTTKNRLPAKYYFFNAMQNIVNAFPAATVIPLYAVSSSNKLLHTLVKSNLPPKILINIEEDVVCPFHYFPDYLPLLLKLAKYVTTEVNCVSIRQYSDSVHIDTPHIKNPLSILINNYRASLGLPPINVPLINTDPLVLLSFYIH